MSRFEFNDPFNFEGCAPVIRELSIKPASVNLLILLRSIVGSVSIKDSFTGFEFDQTIDYLDLNGTFQHQPFYTRLRRYLAPEMNDEDFCELFKNRRLLYQNKAFFDSLNQEVSNFFLYQEKKSFTTAFVFLYRILEKISYAFPLIYTSKTNDFKNTYDFLKSCLENNDTAKKGELGFFKAFIKVAFADDLLSGSSINIDILGEDEAHKLQIFNSIKKAVPENIFDPEDTISPAKISVKFLEFSSFIINIRNRFFHLFNAGQPNLESADIIDADTFFSAYNEKVFHWLCLVIAKIFSFAIERTEQVA